MGMQDRDWYGSARRTNGYGSRSGIAVVTGTVVLTVALLSLAVHGDAFLDSSLIGNPLARAALAPLGVQNLDGAMVQSWQGLEENGSLSWAIRIGAAAQEGELSVAYALIDAGAESLGTQLRTAGHAERTPWLYALKAYMYMLVTPWWLIGLGGGIGALVRTWGKGKA